MLHRLNGELNLFLKCTGVKLALEHLSSVEGGKTNILIPEHVVIGTEGLIASLEKARASIY